MRRWRKMTWLILVWTAAIGWWMYGAYKQSDAAKACRAYADPNACIIGYHVGSGVAEGFIFLVWLVGFLVLAVVWFMTGPGRRHRDGGREEQA